MPTPPADLDATFMRRAIHLAMNGRGRVEPNPMVGCVIARGGRVIGEGFHEQFGGPHAEPNALARCTESPAGATAYVTLEPCCHTNKKTPPCAPRLIEAKLARVVVGCVDPNPNVAGRGLAKLRAAGIEVAAPVLEAEAKQLAAPFLKMIGRGEPYVTLKWAETADGKVAGPGGRRTQISNPAASRAIHALRARSDAILVGIGTVLTDNPLLTARGVEPSRPLRRVVLDGHLRIPADSRLVRTAREVPLTVACAAPAADSPRAAELRAAGVEVLAVEVDGGRLSFPRLSAALGGRGVVHLLVEPGPTLAAALLPWADRAWVIRSPNRMDEPTAPAAAPVPTDFVVTGETDLEGDRLTEYLNPKGGVFFAPEPSADFLSVQ